MTEISDLPPRERVARFRGLAVEADSYSERATDKVREAYKVMAAQWRKLADEAEAMADKAERTATSPSLLPRNSGKPRRG